MVIRVQDHIEKFKRKLILWSKSSLTIKNYMSTLHKFAEFLQNEGIEDISGIDEELIEKWLFELQEENGLAPASVARHFATIKVFLESSGLRLDWRSIPVPSSRAEIKFIVLDEEDVWKIINAAPELKIKLMFWLGYEAALRAGELCSLKVRDINFERREVSVIPLKHRQKIPHVIPIESQELVNSLADYIEIKELDIDDWLFPGKSKERPMNPSYFSSYIFRPIVEGLGLDKKYGGKIRFHDFSRHSRATNLLRRGVDIYTVNRIMRHKRLDTTTIYLHLIAEDLRKRLNV